MQLPCKPFATTLSCELVSRWICINTEKAEMAERSRLIDAGNGHAHFRLGGSGSLWHYAFALNSRALCSTRPGREAIMKLAKRFRNPTALQVKQNWQRQGIRLRAPGLGPQCPTTALCFPQRLSMLMHAEESLSGINLAHCIHISASQRSGVPNLFRSGKQTKWPLWNSPALKWLPGYWTPGTECLGCSSTKATSPRTIEMSALGRAGEADQWHALSACHQKVLHARNSVWP